MNGTRLMLTIPKLTEDSICNKEKRQFNVVATVIYDNECLITTDLNVSEE